ncbi:MAG: HEAT repeat domain-containing protein [Pseudomonadota bacterium]
MRSASWQNRRDVIQQLAGSADPQAGELLATALGDGDDVIAREAAEALARKRTPDALESLTRQVRDGLMLRSIPGGATNQWRFESLVRALAEYGPAAVETLIAVVQNRDAEVAARGREFEGSGAVAAIEALEKVVDPRAMSALAGRLKENGLGYYAAKAIAEYGAAGEDLLVSKLKDANPTVRQHAVHTLGQMGSPRPVPLLCELLGDSDAEVRGLAASALESLGDSRAVERLAPLLEDRDSNVRARAGAALEKLSWRPVTEHDGDLLAIAKGEIHRAAIQGPEAIRPLLRELAACYGFEGMAKKDDALAMQQLGWAMRKESGLLPTLDSLLPMVKALERILERDGAETAEADLRMLMQMPDLKVQYMAQVVRENYHSGAEYTEEVLTETSVDCGRVRSLAGNHLPSSGEKL